MITRAQAETLRNNQNVRVFLDAIAEAEGTTKHGYATAFGGGKLSSLLDHPRKLANFSETTGRRNSTSAAGRYQFLQSTWDEIAKKLGLTDFGPEAQDMAAIALLDRAGALQDVLRGDLQSAARKSGKTWASLPSSPYAQPKKSEAAFNRILSKAAGGTLPAMASTTSTPDALPPASAGGAAVPLINEPAGVMATNFGQSAPNRLSYQDKLDEIERTQSADVQAWEQGMLNAAVDDDAARSRSAALAQFFGEPAIPELQVPEVIDESINRYLAQLT